MRRINVQVDVTGPMVDDTPDEQLLTEVKSLLGTIVVPPEITVVIRARMDHTGASTPEDSGNVRFI